VAGAAVGIDLGTTHTVVAWARLDGASPAELFGVPQLVAPREVQSRPLFPSMLYAPVDGEHVEDPFEDAPWVLGELARRRGAEVPGRLVVSSKSWLVHAGVDRSASILPWGAAEGVPRVSPIEAATRLLAHVRRTWDAAHPRAPLAEQDVVLTVPASFDEVARELTVQAAQHAGLAPRLLEEPQAAFYDWMARAGPEGLSRLLDDTGGRALVLVVDVGGGTTDLSLVRVSSDRRVSRVAVGPHLLLGGDNMDLAIAHAVEPRLVEGGAKLDPARFAQLVSACRAAKERLLGVAPGAEVSVGLLGSGAKLVGGAKTAVLGRDEVERIVLDGFLPAVTAGARPERVRGALIAFGLPYERDVGMTRHMASFLARHLPAGELPNAVLLNGGVFASARIAERVVEALEGWRGEPAAPLIRLPAADPDLAVARGAVASALARAGRGTRIGGGAPRSYFVAVRRHVSGSAGAWSKPGRHVSGSAGAWSEPGETEGIEQAVCVVPRGAAEGVRHATVGRTFELSMGRPVRFDLLASDEVDAQAGDVVHLDDERFVRMPPAATTLPAGDPPEIRVALEGELTAIGTLDLSCVEIGAPDRRFRLAFQLRQGAETPGRLTTQTPSSPPADARLGVAVPLLDRAFGRPRANTHGREAKDLLRDLERTLGERSRWSIRTNRALYDALLPNARGRRRSADHERVFWLLAGWCVRPGFGDALDGTRVGALVPLFDERLAFAAEARGWQQFWIAWRRAAAGLDEPMQTRIRDFVDPYLAPPEAGLKRPKKPALALDDALEMASTLERVDPRRRSALGGWLLERTWTDRDPRLWAAIGRLGARVPVCASAHHAVGAEVAERWLDHLLREKWETPTSQPPTRRGAALPADTAMRAALQLARLTGDRARDVGDRVRQEVEQRLVSVGATEEQVRPLREVVAVAEGERAAFFGDELPLGLRLVD
jgi:molecular chaperone DnaK (HSP70)